MGPFFYRKPAAPKITGIPALAHGVFIKLLQAIFHPMEIQQLKVFTTLMQDIKKLLSLIPTWKSS